MLFSIGLAAFVPYAILIAVSVVFAYRTVSGDAYRYAATLSEHEAMSTATMLASLVGQGRSLATVFSQYEGIPPAFRRGVINQDLRAFMGNEPELLAAWAQWERGAIGDDPGAYAGGPLTTESGAFNATWYRDGSVLRQGRINDEAYEQDFYTLPKRRGRIVLIEPYWYSYTGRKADEILETSLCFPIVANGDFKGVLGFDFAVSLFKSMVVRTSPFASGYGMLVSGAGTIVGHPNGARLGQSFAESGQKLDEFRVRLASNEPFTLDRSSTISGGDSRYYFSPLKIDGIEKTWYFALVASKSRILAPARVLALTVVGLGALGAVLVFGVILFASRGLSRPIVALSEGAKRISGGDLSCRVEAGGSREVAGLAASFNDMAGKLQETLSGLEARVAERTASLESTNAELQRTLGDLKAAQSGLELSAKMAFLGRLAAGISHELNTPIGAIRSSAAASLGAMESFVELFLPEYSSLSEAERKLFHALFESGRSTKEGGRGHGERQRKAELARRLSAKGLERSWYLADAISNLGAYDLEGRIVDCAARGSWGIVAAAEKAVETCRAAAMMVEASERAGQAVSALANYSRSEELDVLEPLSPAEDLEEVLTLNYGRIRDSVVVERNYACRDLVSGYRDRLKEVWMNLIVNALQAMDFRGRLGLSTEREGEWVVVSVSDSGPGIPADLVNKIFTPFFTTKAPGEGIGLGLDICRRIVERHGGGLSFDTGPGGSVFRVRLRAAGKGI